MTSENDLRSRFIDGMRLAAATVNVVTTDGVAGRAGVTVSAMNAVSADGNAPTLLVCVHHLSAAAARIVENGCFCVNILRDDQSHISDSFAGRLKIGDKFSCAQWQRMGRGGWRVRDPLAAFDCDIVSGDRVGAHYVFIGEARDIYVSDFGNPLIYANRAYGASVKLRRSSNGGKRRADFRIGSLHTFGPYLLPPLLRRLRDKLGDIDADIYEGDQRYLLELLRAGTIDAAFLYDMRLGDDIRAERMATFAPYALLAEDHPLAELGELSLRQLLPCPLVLLDAPPSAKYFLSLFTGIGEPFVAYRAKSFEMARGMVANGLGYSLLATRTAAMVSYDGKALETKPLADDLPKSALALCHLRNGAADFSLLTELCGEQFFSTPFIGGRHDC